MDMEVFLLSLALIVAITSMILGCVSLGLRYAESLVWDKNWQTNNPHGLPCQGCERFAEDVDHEESQQ